ncbi:hypothetical protein FRC08_000125 [Ceratobasidium sp. 394]|nr:hypothetical protein FRC08_000125 [Ceratobasidium sp. 394]KAG9101256.1 hypothetical protein FS749_008705 [Ceratobasidium sp. UAMH 11750]
MPSHSIKTPVLQLPEVLDATLRFLAIGDLVPAMRVNHQFFSQAARNLWKTIPHLEILLRLLISHTVFAEASPAQWVRFNVYAPLIHTLDVYGGLDNEFYWQWQRGLSFVGHIGNFPRFKLSNLCQIVVKSHFKVPCTVLHSVLCLVYGPSCTSLELQGNFYGSEHDDGRSIDLSQALDAIWGNRLLQRLVLLVPIPMEAAGWSNLTTGLDNTPSLTSLKLDVSMLENDSFAAVGRLPLLQTLFLVHQELTTFDVNLAHVLQPPDGSFTALKHLGIYGRWSLTALISLMNLTPLFTCLESIDLNIHQRGNMTALFSSLQDCAPYLRKLQFSFGVKFQVGALELEPLTHLPLDQIFLGEVQLRDEEDLCPLLRPVRAWQTSLTCFRMPSHIISAAELRILAGFSSLRVLVVALGLGDLEEEFPATSWDLPPIGQQVLRLENSYRFGWGSNQTPERVARFLLYCWRNVELVIEEVDKSKAPVVSPPNYRGKIRRLFHALAEMKSDMNGDT